MEITTDQIKLNQTCSACPEQFDAYLEGDLDNKQVGYLRLRHGYFSVEYPDSGGETIYEAQPNGDGCFTVKERDYYLDKAKESICKKLNSLPN